MASDQSPGIYQIQGRKILHNKFWHNKMESEITAINSFAIHFVQSPFQCLKIPKKSLSWMIYPSSSVSLKVANHQKKINKYVKRIYTGESENFINNCLSVFGTYIRKWSEDLNGVNSNNKIPLAQYLLVYENYYNLLNATIDYNTYSYTV